VGLRGDRYALPAYSTDLMGGGIVGLLLCPHGGKVHLASGSTASLYPDIPPDDWVLIVEGPWDALMGRQYGLPTVTCTTGADTWKDEWSLELEDHRAFVLYDCDHAGRKGAEKVKASMPHATIVDLAPRLSNGYDLSDHLRKYGSTDRLMEFINGKGK
jgi:DNA primase